MLSILQNHVFVHCTRCDNSLAHTPHLTFSPKVDGVSTSGRVTMCKHRCIRSTASFGPQVSRASQHPPQSSSFIRFARTPHALLHHHPILLLLCRSFFIPTSTMLHLRRSAFVTSAGVVSCARFQSSWVCSQRPSTSTSSFVPARLASPCMTRAVRTVRMEAAPAIVTEPVGEENTLDFRLQFKTGAGSALSPWHDIPLRPEGSDASIVNFVNEIPRGEQAKMEIATDEESNPIKQDVKKGALRFYKWGPSLVNYGAVPQTWEDPRDTHAELQLNGDGDPLDVTEIGSKVMPFGAVYPVKVLGCLALLDEGEVDWKIIAINCDDPLAAQMNDIADVERLMPGKVDEVRQWFRLYKTAEGKGENEYGYDGEAKDKDFALKVIDETYESWVNLRKGAITNEDGLALK